MGCGKRRHIKKKAKGKFKKAKKSMEKFYKKKGYPKERRSGIEYGVAQKRGWI
jgi:hypothetical protein